MTKRYPKFLALCACLGGLIAFLSLPTFAQSPTARRPKILLIPLDDRPPCLQFPVRMGLIGDAEIVTPPRPLLGRFTEFGKSDEIIRWVGQQDLKRFDAAIISVDMLAYGGLVAMRVHETSEAEALRRLAFVKEMRKRAPDLKIYGSSVIMRLAPTGTLANQAYRENLAKWAEISVDPARATETAALERLIPAAALADYRQARARDLKINRRAVEFVKDKTFDRLILSQDDAKPKGVHVADREALIEFVKNLNLSEKIAVQPGADEVSMLLLARAFTDRSGVRPKIKAVYSSEKVADEVMPYEDRALRQTVSFHIKSVGATEVKNEADADILFYVFASRFEAGRAASFAQEIAAQVAAGRRVSVADIDTKGDVQGGDRAFTEELLNRKVFRRLASYAAWNTAGNTIGTTLPQGVIFTVREATRAASKNGKPARGNSKSSRAPNAPDRSAQDWFTLNRLFDDYVFHTLVRPDAQRLIRSKQWNALRLNDEQAAEITRYGLQQTLPHAARIAQKYFADDRCTISELNFILPWNRTFEAEIDFANPCPEGAPKPLL